MNNPIIDPIAPNKAKGKAKDLLDGVQRSLGATPNLFAAMAHAPAALGGYLQLSSSLATGDLPPQLREQVALTVAGINGCDYCSAAHTFIGKKSGIAEDELARNRAGNSADVTTQAGLDFASKLVRNNGQVTPEDVQQVRNAGYSDERIIEIVAHVALNILTNYFNIAFGTEVDFPKVESLPAQTAV
ncbi:carboxymuconolactone decarboxylase family protein [Roseibacillus persicicus]|uniref:carboxymuconolactone decarboxylase family protein n=1 Tax=Roseibacillus persicicus TaxID=454148 RepID=UPI00398A7838